MPTQYEYGRFPITQGQFDADSAAAIRQLKELNELGSEGWQLASIEKYIGGDDRNIGIFMRSKCTKPKTKCKR